MDVRAHKIVIAEVKKNHPDQLVEDFMKGERYSHLPSACKSLG